MSKISHLGTQNTNYKHDFLCISKTYFNSAVQEGGRNMHLNDYNMIRSDYTSNAKRGGICIFYKVTLEVRFVNLQCIICEVSIQNNKGYIVNVYRSPSQDANDFQNFLSNLETILNDNAANNALLTFVLGYFKAKFSA